MHTVNPGAAIKKKRVSANETIMVKRIQCLFNPKKARKRERAKKI